MNDTTTTNVRAGQVLQQAAVLLQTHGWARNTFQTPDGAYCLAGAVAEAVDRSGAPPCGCGAAPRRTGPRGCATWFTAGRTAEAGTTTASRLTGATRSTKRGAGGTCCGLRCTHCVSS